jgi:hypothetical protein
MSQDQVEMLTMQAALVVLVIAASRALVELRACVRLLRPARPEEATAEVVSPWSDTSTLDEGAR